ncbi:MAG: HEAT repeat domain-containing protein [Candidatus Eisenbacteria bacterium]
MDACPLLPLSARDDAQESVDAPTLREAAAWAVQLVRTLKTCRLYDANNPAVVRFREELVQALHEFLQRFGALRLEVTSSALLYAGQPVHTARSRDDNLGGVLHRDGIRAITLQVGIEAREVESMLDHILHMSGPSAGDDDLVTLLWEANLPHVELATVPIEGDVDGGGDEDGTDGPAPVAWPRQSAGAAPPLDAAGASGGVTLVRSDDWTTLEDPADLDQAFEELETAALNEIARFQQECERATREDLVTGMIAILEDCLATDTTPADLEELAHFIPRVLREAIGLGRWETARAALRLLRSSDSNWPMDGFFASLNGPYAITTRKAVAALDQHDASGVASFLALGRDLGRPAVEWLMHVLAESQQKRARRPLARMIAELIADNPERILPSLADERWYVVRNAVHILGWVGGDGIAGFLRTAAEHPEMRVRREVVAALSQVNGAASRPILTDMLALAEPALFAAILHQLAPDGDRSVSELLLSLLRDERFATRTEEEKRAVYLALATRSDEVLETLETELNRGGLFSLGREPGRQAVARCVARIGTPAALAVLERGARSHKAAVRKACLIAGATAEGQHE